MKKPIPGFNRYYIEIKIFNTATENQVLPVMITEAEDGYMLRDDKGISRRIDTNEILSSINPAADCTMRPEKVFDELIEIVGSDFLKYDASTEKRVYGKVTREQALIIRKRLTAGETAAQLSKEFGVHRSTISLIKSNKIHAEEAQKDGE